MLLEVEVDVISSQSRYPYWKGKHAFDDDELRDLVVTLIESHGMRFYADGKLLVPVGSRAMSLHGMNYWLVLD